jgi:hypothetical protein
MLILADLRHVVIETITRYLKSSSITFEGNEAPHCQWSPGISAMTVA